MVIVIIVVVVLILLAVFYYIAKRNGIISSRNRVDESWSGIDVQLKRRHDLVPNLVETVKGYASHERRSSRKSPRRAPSRWPRRASRTPPPPRPS